MSSAAPVEAEPGRPWRGQSPVERREARRQRLLEAALELFGTAGYAATSLTALCAEAGVSPRHFYDLHPGREELLAELYERLVGESLTRVRAAQDAAPATVEAQVRAGLTAIVRDLTDDPRRGRVVLLEVVGVSPVMDRMRRAVIAGYADQVEGSHRRLVEAGALPARSFGALATGLVGAVNELLVAWLLTEPRPPADDVLPAVVEIFEAVFTHR